MSENTNVAEFPAQTGANSISLFMPTDFESAQRMAKALATSSLVPQQYQNNIANCLISLDMAMRLKANVLMIMQNLYIVHGRPGWSAQFLVATFNTQRGFSPLRYEFKGKEKTDGWACRAYAMDLDANERLDGTWITWEMAKAEGWVDKNGSKWKTMPEQMMRYRAASFFIRTYAPDVSMGLYTQEELFDMPVIEGEVVAASDEAKTIDDIIEGNETVAANADEKEEAKPAAAESSEFNLETVIAQIKSCKDTTELFQAELLIGELPNADQGKAKLELEVKQDELGFDPNADVPQ